MTSLRSGLSVFAWLVSVLVGLLPGSSELYAQTRDAALRIEVKDPSGHAMRASGRLHNLIAGSKLEFQTDREGRSSFF